ncbi:MAG: UvrD-helicase domain-containing protein [Endomicrobiaceae bacterium]|nr:UvrD-helicase domain-containing protein [Endomicrobiaceae bacterium]
MKNTKYQKNQIIVCEASAGSGKTYNLTQRYIELLLNFDKSIQKSQLKNIIALTFTNKASTEMKERIIDTLKKIAFNYNTDDFTSAFNEDDIGKKAIIALNDIINYYDYFNVKTIDSFINLIIKACAINIGFSPNYKIADNYKEYVDFAIDAFLDNATANKNYQSIINDYLEQYLANQKDSWFCKRDISAEFISIYNKIKNSPNNLKYSNSDYKSVAIKLSTDFYDICIKISKDDKLKNTHANFIKNVAKIKEYGKYYLLANEVSTFWAKEHLHYNKDKEHSTVLDELFVKAKEILKDFYEFKATTYYSVYMKMFEEIDKELAYRTNKDSVLLLNEINKKSMQIFNQENNIVPEVYCRLSNYFKDFLIDEFQDTNKIQWQALKTIIYEILSHGGSFFYVGDIKQAIYAFRGSDSKIFNQALMELDQYNPVKKTLGTNYRSHKNIVDFNNNIFSQDNIKNFLSILLGDTDNEYLSKYGLKTAEIFQSSKQKHLDKKNSGYVEIKTFDGDSSEEIDLNIKNQLLETIDNLIQRFQYKDITIICRDNDSIEQISSWLLEKNINIESTQTLNIINSSIIKEILSFMKFLNSPMDRISFVSFIISNIFLKQTKLDKNEVLQFITDNDSNQTLYIKFRKKYTEIWENYIEHFFNSIGFISVYELVVSIVSEYNIIENFKDSANIIMHLLEVLSVFETKNYGLKNFIKHFQDVEERQKDKNYFIKIPSNNAIKITTVHQAKGLQFNVVIMPFLALTDLSPKKPFVVEDSKNISFLDISKPYMPYSQKLKDTYYNAYFEKISDELNILYVAMTRAVYEFYGFIPEKFSGKKNKILDLFKQKEIKQGIQQIYQINKKITSDTIDLNQTQIKDISEIISDNVINIYGKKRSEILTKGKIIHYALSTILTLDKNEIAEKIKTAMILTALKYPNEDISYLSQTLTALFKNEKILSFFKTSDTTYNEKEFIDINGNTLRIDKLTVSDDIITIIDFKTSIYDKEMINSQMQNYISVINNIYQDKTIKCVVIDIENIDIQEIP